MFYGYTDITYLRYIAVTYLGVRMRRTSLVYYLDIDIILFTQYYKIYLIYIHLYDLKFLLHGAQFQKHIFLLFT